MLDLIGSEPVPSTSRSARRAIGSPARTTETPPEPLGSGPAPEEQDLRPPGHDAATCDEVGPHRACVQNQAAPDPGASESFEALDRDDEDRRAADLDFERVGHEELARLHDRRHRVDDLRPWTCSSHG